MRALQGAAEARLRRPELAAGVLALLARAVRWRAALAAAPPPPPHAARSAALACWWGGEGGPRSAAAPCDLPAVLDAALAALPHVDAAGGPPLLVRLPSGLAGEAGLFVLGALPAGSLCCLYPGMIYEPGAGGAALAAWRNAYVMRLADGALLDGRYFGLSRWLFRGAARRAGPAGPGADGARLLDGSWLDGDFLPRGAAAGRPAPGLAALRQLLLTAPNPWAHGCLINHYAASSVSALAAAPPAPNVAYVEASLRVPAALQPALPYVHHDGRAPAGEDGDARVVALLALRDLRDEELLTDYSFIARPPPA